MSKRVANRMKKARLARKEPMRFIEMPWDGGTRGISDRRWLGWTPNDIAAYKDHAWSYNAQYGNREERNFHE